MDERIYPLTFTPVLRDYIWGGRRLETLYGRSLPPGIVAESWEISGHPSAPTEVDAGFWQGRTLPEVLGKLGEGLTGTHARWALERNRFPLLVKLLDAHQDLSVQVHPDDAYGLAHEGDLGKTEMWYVLHTEPGSEVILGLQPGTTRERFRRALEAGELEKVLHHMPVAAGQSIAIPAGTIHALRAGSVVTEIQQNSDATYRVYDWGRMGADGKPRQLHVDKALDVIDFAQATPGVVLPQELSRFGGVGQAELVRNRYFVVEELSLEAGSTFAGTCDGVTMEIWGCLAGAVDVACNAHEISLPAIRYALLPAILGDFRIMARAMSTCLRVYLPGSD